MKKSTRNKEAIDYKKLNTTGIKEIEKKVSEEEDIIGELSQSLETLTMAEGRLIIMKMESQRKNLHQKK